MDALQKNVEPYLMRPSILALAVLLLMFLFSWAFKSSICISLPGTLWNTLEDLIGDLEEL